MVSSRLLVFMTLALPFSTASAADAPILLWPGTPPGETAPLAASEGDVSKPTDGPVAGKPLVRLGNVSTPTLTLYRPTGANNGAAVVVFPGGGYNILAYDLEGQEVCAWLNARGLTCALVKYRVPARPGGPRYAAPLQDAQRAVGLVRSRAAEWGIDPKRIGVLGFSAGGHLSAAVSTNYAERKYPKVDQHDDVSCRPDFAVLVYPAYLAPSKTDTALSPELAVTKETPPTFLVQTQDDNIPVENALFYFLALKRAEVQAELHVYSKGGHGYGLRPSENAVSGWPTLVDRWLQSIGVLR